MSSPAGKGVLTAMTTSGISATFVGNGGATFREQTGPSDPTGCTIAYQYDPGGSAGGVAGDMPVPVATPVSAGRIWGHIQCPKAIATGQPGVMCDAEADFLFEQCNP